MFLFCFTLVTCLHCSLISNYVTKNEGKKPAGEEKGGKDEEEHPWYQKKTHHVIIS